MWGWLPITWRKGGAGGGSSRPCLVTTSGQQLFQLEERCVYSYTIFFGFGHEKKKRQLFNKFKSK